MSVEFTVFGAPATKGSTVSFMGRNGRIVTKGDCATLAAWTQAVGWAARIAQVPFYERPVPVRVHASFRFPFPKKRRLCPTVRPDIDKIFRALLDALTGIAYADDAQVVEIFAMKLYTPASEARTVITVGDIVLKESRHA